VQRGIIWKNGRRMGVKRLNGRRDAKYRTNVVQRKCHIANVICMFFSWRSFNILQVQVLVFQPLKVVFSCQMVILTHQLFKNTSITVLKIFIPIQAPSTSLIRTVFLSAYPPLAAISSSFFRSSCKSNELLFSKSDSEWSGGPLLFMAPVMLLSRCEGWCCR
jgi:hypothetical protein